MPLKQALIYFTKEPIEGKVKTRLARTIGDVEATKIYKLLLENLLNLNISSHIDTFISLDIFTDNYNKSFQEQTIIFQKGKNIGEKMANAFLDIFEKGYESVILVGADIPLIDENIIDDAFNDLKQNQAILSKTKDEGYYLIGFQKKSFTKKPFEIDFSNAVYKKTLQALKPLRVKEGFELFDIDEIEDLRRFANISEVHTNEKLHSYSKTLLSKLPKISVIIPVYYEKENLPKTIEHLKSNAKDNDYEIIVCDTPLKTTIEDIDCSNLKTLISKKAGRAFQLNSGAVYAKAEVLFFLHADSFVPKNWDETIYNKYLKNKELAGAFTLGIKTTNSLIKIIEFFANVRVKVTNTPYGDQGQFFSSALFHEIKGYDEIPLMEDIAIIRKIHSKNIPIKILKDKIYTSDRRWQKEGIFYTTLRNRVLSTLYLLGVSSEKLKKYYKF